MPLTAAELTTELQETNRRLTDSIDRLRDEVKGLRSDFSATNNSLGWVIKIGSSIGGTLLACMLGILGFAYNVDQRAARIESAVAVLRKDSLDLESGLKTRDDRLAQALERIEKSLANNQVSPVKPPQ